MLNINLGHYSKAVTAAIGLALTYASQYYGTNHWVATAVAIATLLGVYVVPNSPKPPPPPTGM